MWPDEARYANLRNGPAGAANPSGAQILGVLLLCANLPPKRDNQRQRGTKEASEILCV